jgi:hypothetical protein
LHTFPFLYDPQGHNAEQKVKLPIDVGYLDARFTPNDVKETEGVAHLTYIPDWTVLGFYDRSGDGRYASNSNFVVRGKHSFDEMVMIARAKFPSIWNRFTFEVVSDGAAPDDGVLGDERPAIDFWYSIENGEQYIFWRDLTILKELRPSLLIFSATKMVSMSGNFNCTTMA